MYNYSIDPSNLRKFIEINTAMNNYDSKLDEYGNNHLKLVIEELKTLDTFANINIDEILNQYKLFKKSSKLFKKIKSKTSSTIVLFFEVVFECEILLVGENKFFFSKILLSVGENKKMTPRGKQK